MAPLEPVDVLVFGGGPVGLAAALTLVRQGHTAILFDSGSYRNVDVKHMHMIPTWDHRNPAEFREKARFEIQNHYASVRIEDVEITAVRTSNDSLFEVTDGNSRAWKGKKIILATGSANIFLDILGYVDCLAKRIYHCLYCEGYEDRETARSGVLAIQTASIAPMAIHLAGNAANLSSSVTIYTDGSGGLSTQIQTSLGYTNQEKFTDLSLGSWALKTTTLSPVPEVGDIVANFPAYQTSVRGVFAAGDCITQYKVIAGAISSGCNAAVAASAQLLAEKYQHESLV
ncbi:hypothetical protein EMPG_15765 [Blastomyces silverae]|uniref:FAD/NAD(P)-binding domain-containing protein n=1 Tax=Blastomyces silverae TaxID=2060906 RepID=A0A0H1BCS7_9EURO|nr:hypothetical protein EMPG_15765 [Blastomyces silverae]